MTPHSLNFQPQNILVINFGQLGDVVLSLPAFRAVRQKFPQARITAAVGKSTAAVLDLANVCDEKIVVDRVALRDGNKLVSINEIRRLVADVRRRRFDFVLDLHSLSETNLLGFFSGARKRLYAHRESRSLDFLANFDEKPPREDKSKHATLRYLDVLKPLGIADSDTAPHIVPRPAESAEIAEIWRKFNFEKKKTVGFFVGAGHDSRRWNLEKFAALAAKIERNDERQIIVFLGPEEGKLKSQAAAEFPQTARIFDDLSLMQFVAALGSVEIFITNDTGPLHLAAAVGAQIVLVMDKDAPTQYVPLVDKIKVVNNAKISEIAVEDVYSAVRELINRAN